MKRHAFLIAGFVALVLSAPVEAKRKSDLLITVDTSQIGQPPDEAATARDLAIVLATQAERTPEREERAIRDAKQSLAGFLNGMDADVRKRHLKRASRLFKEATGALEETLAPVKGRFDRPRPFKASAEVKTCETKLPPSSSFPSTHAGTGALFATLLAHAAPERKAELETRGLDYGWSRVVCGFHYPSDIEAGRKGGRLVAEALLSDPAFTKRLDKVTPALRKALGL